MANNDNPAGTQGTTGSGNVDIAKLYEELKAEHEKASKSYKELQSAYNKRDEEVKRFREANAKWDDFYRRDIKPHEDDIREMIAQKASGRKPKWTDEQTLDADLYGMGAGDDESAKALRNQAKLEKQLAELHGQFQTFAQSVAQTADGFHKQREFDKFLTQFSRRKAKENPDYDEDAVYKHAVEKGMALELAYQELYGPKLKEKEINTRVEQELKKREEEKRAQAAKSELSNIQGKANVLPMSEKLKKAIETYGKEGPLNREVPTSAERSKSWQEKKQRMYEKALKDGGVDSFFGE